MINSSSRPTAKILLLGSSGQIGHELESFLSPAFDVTTLGRAELDISNADKIRTAVREVKPDIIINAAAYTAVDKAEEEEELATAINATAPAVLAEEAKRLDATLVSYSTDFVFDGKKNSGPYTENDTPNPINVYGHTKLEGDLAIQQVNPAYLIFRTGWVYGLRGKNFLLTIQRLAREKSELTIVDDQVGSPTWSRVIAKATTQIISKLSIAKNGATFKDVSGVYNLTCAGSVSWYGFAKAIVDYMPKEERPKITPVSTSQYPTAAQRPAYSALSLEKLKKTFGVSPPTWNEALELCLNKPVSTSR